MSETKQRSGSLSFKDLTGRERGGGRNESENYGNVHIRVEGYVRDKDNRAVAVQGTNLKTGQDITVGLAGVDQLAKMYMSQTEDLSVRQNKARKLLSNRPPLAEFGQARGNKAVPVGGVISIEEVRKDYKDRRALWPLAGWPGQHPGSGGRAERVVRDQGARRRGSAERRLQIGLYRAFASPGRASLAGCFTRGVWTPC